MSSLISSGKPSRKGLPIFEMLEIDCSPVAGELSALQSPAHGSENTWGFSGSSSPNLLITTYLLTYLLYYKMVHIVASKF